MTGKKEPAHHHEAAAAHHQQAARHYQIGKDYEHAAHQAMTESARYAEHHGSHPSAELA